MTVVLVRAVKIDTFAGKLEIEKYYHSKRQLGLKLGKTQNKVKPAPYGLCLRFLHNQFNRHNQRPAFVHI